MNFLVMYLRQLRHNLNQLGDHNYVSPKEMGDRIPKGIHQTYYKKDLPIELQNNVNQLKLMNPDWSYKIYDDSDIENYIELHYPELVAIYHKINPIYGAARADFFRYLLIYNEGGVYLDIKSSVTKPLDEIIKNDDVYLLSHWNNDLGESQENAGLHHRIDNPYGEFQQWHIVAAKGHPFLKAVIDNVCHNIHIYNAFFNQTGRWGVLNVTGPIAYTLAITPYLNQYPHRLERSGEDYNFVYSVLSDIHLRKHHTLFKKHYSALEEAIVKQSFLARLIFKVVQPVKDKIFELMRSFV